MQQRNFHFRHQHEEQPRFYLPKHQRTKSKTLITYENEGATYSRYDPVQNYTKDHYPYNSNIPTYGKAGLDDLAYTKASTLQMQIVQDNAYLKSSIRYFQKQNQRLLKQIADKDHRINNNKDQLNRLLIKQNQALVNENRSFEKALHSRSKSRLNNNKFMSSYKSQKSEQDYNNRPVDSKYKYLKGLKSIKGRLQGVEINDTSKHRDYSQSRNHQF